MVDPRVFSWNASIVVLFLASFLVWIMVAGVGVLWIFDNGKEGRSRISRAFGAALASWAITAIVKILHPTTRPFEIAGFSPLTLTLPKDGSFPSGHAAFAWSLATVLYSYNKFYGLLFSLLALGVSIGRVLSGVHFVTDVLVGSVVGVSVGYAFSGALYSKIPLKNANKSRRK
jgi:undecaprenyl-diphosphatase